MQTLDPETAAGARALERLARELIGWLTTVNPEGQAQSSPIWFLWRDGELLIYSHRRAPRNVNIVGRPLVAFNLETAADGDEFVTMEGYARIDLGVQPSSADPAYQARYGHLLDRYDWTPEWASIEYPIPILIRPSRWRVG